MVTATINTEHFVGCSPSLARDKGEHQDIGFGTNEHMAKVVASINFDMVFSVKGDKTAMRSFNSWPVHMRILLQSWHELLIILCLVCLKLEIFPADTLPHFR